MSALGCFALTLFVHSVLAAAAVAVFQHHRRRRGEAPSELWWRIALLGPILSASLATFVAAENWRIPLPAFGRAATSEPATSAPSRDPDFAPAGHSAAGSRDGPRRGATPRSPRTGREPRAAPSVPANRSAPATLDVPRALESLLLATILLGTIRELLRALRGARGALRGREPLHDPALRRVLSTLVRRAGLHRPVRLTANDRLSTPVSFGVFRPEICLPATALAKLDQAVWESVLAHEVRHLARRDPLWSWIHLFCRGLMPLLPCTPWILRQLDRCAERDCDDWAADRCGGPLRFAAALTQVASLRPLRGARVALLAMAGVRPSLVERVEHLLARDADPTKQVRGRTLPTALGLSALLLLLPGVAPRIAASPQAPRAPEPRATPSVADLERGAYAVVEQELARLEEALRSLRISVETHPHDPEVQAQLVSMERQSAALRSVFHRAKHRQATRAPSGKDESPSPSRE